jgi:ACS family glucarate transporter-like MFS transporter
LATAGLTALRLTTTAPAGVACFGLATFGAEMTISPSWAFCIDLGKKKSGSVSGAMNMVGNLGSFVSASVFPLMYRLTGDSMAYFLTAAALNLGAAAMWLAMETSKPEFVMEKPCEA